MPTKSTRNRARFQCLDCKVDTGKIHEFYFINLELWLKATASNQGMLCIGCLESRIGRILTPCDFTQCTINSPKHSNMSDRLRNRIANT